jgi:serine protease AprX
MVTLHEDSNARPLSVRVIPMVATAPTNARRWLWCLAAVVVAPASVAVSVGEASAVPTEGRSSLLGGSADRWMADKDLGSLYSVNKGAGVQDLWAKSDAQGRKVTGKGIGVALIDSGVAPVTGLADGRVFNGPDLSFESQAGNLRYLDTFGHGTHMAGIIAGRDPEVKEGSENDSKYFVGVAPGSTLVSVKVATSDGATDVTQVIAGIDWAVEHRDDPGLNIRVINLSYGTDSVLPYQVDPLVHAVEMAWRKGIVVVVAAGNGGNTTDRLTNPAVDPYVIAVGASDSKGTESRTDDAVATFSNRGSTTRSPDLVAPGRSLVSLRAPGSGIDQDFPTGVVNDAKGVPRFFRGSGTSQAAAFTSGTVALLLQQRPNLTPDQVKRLLTSTADPIAATDRRLQGSGLIDVKQAGEAATPTAVQSFSLSTGVGSLEAARGTSHVADPETGVELTGEKDIFGQAWDGRSWAEASWNGRSWAGGTWNGRSWAGTSWTGRSWASTAWTGVSWTGRSWAGRSWADNVWDGRSWAGRSWAGRSWAGRSWAGRSWAGSAWTGRARTGLVRTGQATGRRARAAGCV